MNKKVQQCHSHAVPSFSVDGNQLRNSSTLQPSKDMFVQTIWKMLIDVDEKRSITESTSSGWNMWDTDPEASERVVPNSPRPVR